MAQQRLNVNTVDRGFWLINEEHVFSDPAYKLFGILLHLFNVHFWPEYIEKTDDYFSGCIHTSRNTLRKARNELIAAGIIECKQGGRGRNCATRYSFSAHILDLRLTTKADTSINDIKRK